MVRISHRISMERKWPLISFRNKGTISDVLFLRDRVPLNLQRQGIFLHRSVLHRNQFNEEVLTNSRLNYWIVQASAYVYSNLKLNWISLRVSLLSQTSGARKTCLFSMHKGISSAFQFLGDGLWTSVFGNLCIAHQRHKLRYIYKSHWIEVLSHQETAC